ncbi:DNA damage-binding protein cmr1 [Rhynchospora pubera]|uniref:DNA damage-binding protein cmr1 n=1 Tax=Rhynchospora pubera TaxID=906938 RepID=A0AAV8FF51_9POAL|nr:DNA damage-binding protein cmr1 [Rhynchospora pubera]
MAPPKKANSTMALDYEQLRQENIKRNKEMIASILHQKSQLAALLAPPKPTRSLSKPTTPKPPPATLRRSLRSRGLPPPLAFTDAFLGSDSWRHLVDVTCLSGERREIGDSDNEVSFGLDARVELGLKKGNVRTVGNDRIVIVRFLPLLSRSIVVSGSEQGSLGFWDAGVNGEDGEGDSDGVYVSFPHNSHVSGISVHPSSVGKIYSSCHDGDLCLMDMEKEMFDIIHTSEFSIFSLSQLPHDDNSLLLGYEGKVKSFDGRTGKIIDVWEMHEQRVNTIDVHPGNSNLVATCSADGFVRIWDLRCLGKEQPKSIKEVAHNRAVQSAYFSPNGNGLVSTSTEDTIRIWGGPHFENLSIVKHNNKAAGRLSSFRAIWGWNDSYIFIGNIQRAIDVISTENNITTPLKSEYMTNVPCRFATHPYKEGLLACAGGGKLFLWTKM